MTNHYAENVDGFERIFAKHPDYSLDVIVRAIMNYSHRPGRDIRADLRDYADYLQKHLTILDDPTNRPTTDIMKERKYKGSRKHE